MRTLSGFEQTGFERRARTVSQNGNHFGHFSALRLVEVGYRPDRMDENARRLLTVVLQVSPCKRIAAGRCQSWADAEHVAGLADDLTGARPVLRWALSRWLEGARGDRPQGR